MNTKQQMFGSYVKAACEHPLMYTFNGTFAEVIILLDSYAKGDKVFHQAGHHALDPFHRWLAKNKPQFEQIGGFVGWSSFWDYYQDDNKALHDFKEFYLEFQKTCTGEEKFEVELNESEVHFLYKLISQNLENAMLETEIKTDLNSIKTKLEKTWQVFLNRTRLLKPGNKT